MSRTAKVLIGIASFLSVIMVPIVIFSVIGGFVPHIIELEQQGMDPDPMTIVAGVGAFIGAILFMVFLSIGLFVYFIIHLMRDPSADSDTRVLWILLLFFLSNFVYPFYWYFRIWRPNDVGPDVSFETRMN